jgi:dihydrodipicolinate synthase/N-acetylneuraminate lyase
MPDSPSIPDAGALSGVTCVLVTPFRDRVGPPDTAVLERLVQRLDAAGVPAITALGNTAEVFQLTGAERRTVLEAVAGATGQATLITGVTGPLVEAVGLTELAAGHGYAAAMLHDPPDPLAGEAGLVRLLHEFADRSALSTVLYLRTTRLGPSALAEVVAHPRIVAVKYARPDVGVLAGLLADPATRDACTWVCGLAESMVLPMRGPGVIGFTSGVANVRPDLALAVWRASRDGDLPALSAHVAPLLAIERMRTRAGGRHNVSVLKAALALEGLDAGDVRPPCEPLGAAELAELRAALDALPEPVATPA